MAVILAVLLAGAGLGTGLASWFAPTSSESPRDRPTGDAEGPFAERQASVNRSHIPTKQLADFAAPWLDRMGDCTGDTQSGGPERGDGEQTRTRCTAGIAAVYWISYRSIADRDAAQARYAAQAAQSQHLAPGMLQPNPAAADHAPQLHVEYAYRMPAGEHAGQTVAALWWSDPAQPVAGVLTAYWEEGLGSSWRPCATCGVTLPEPLDEREVPRVAMADEMGSTGTAMTGPGTGRPRRESSNGA